MTGYRPWGITVVAVLMVIFGLAEVATGISHTFLGILSTADSALSTYATAAVGALYAAGGVLLLTMKKQAAVLAVLCLLVVIIGRIFLVLAGLYPVTTPLQLGSIIVGTAIAVIFTLYIRMSWKVFG